MYVYIYNMYMNISIYIRVRACDVCGKGVYVCRYTYICTLAQVKTKNI